MKMAILTSGETALAHVAEAYRSFGDKEREQLRLVVIDLGREYTDEWIGEIGRRLEGVELALFEAHGVRKETVQALSGLLCAHSAQLVPIGSDSADIRSLLRLGKLSASDLPPPQAGLRAESALPEDARADYARYMRLTEYWRGGGADNMKGLLGLVGREYGGCLALPEPSEPVYIRELCVFDPVEKRVYDSVSAFRNRSVARVKGDKRIADRHAPGRPTVALLFLGNGNPTDVADCMAQLAERIGTFADVLPIAFPSVMHIPAERLRELLLDGDSRVRLIVNALPFRLGAGPTGEVGARMTELLEELAVPMLHPFLLSGATVDEWKDSARGLAASQLLVQVMLPELDGSIETYPIAALRREGEDAGLGVAASRLIPIPERMERLSNRIRRWLELQSKPNRDKKLALVCYNYPPGEANVFGGAFLDTFESVSRLLGALRDRGYDTEPMTAGELHARFLEGGLVNSGKWTTETAADALIRYADPDFASKLAAQAWGGEALSRWGEPPGEVMTEDGSFLIPGIVNGNVFIGLQPTRGIHEQPEKSLHDRSILPTHPYTAFYQWIREKLAADAVVHIGTHGTLEFQRGKEAGMSGDCVPDHLIGDLPHLYYYYVGNPSEAMIAKRRSHATLIGYQAPPMTEAELYGDWLALEALLHEYREAEQLDPDRCESILGMALDRAASLHVTATDLDRLEEELYRMKRSVMPSGLHVLGDGYSCEAAIAHMRFVLRHERGEARSLRGLLAERRGLDAAELADSGQTAVLRDLDAEADALVDNYMAMRQLPAKYADDSPAWQAALLRSLEYGRRAYDSTLVNEELEGFLRALEGRYVPAQLAGDVLRSPEVLPSGRNLYQSDPRSVPSPTAAERGAVVAEQSIRQYAEAHGEYPRTTAVVLWGLETSRTQGETIGQILHYLGVRAKRGGGLRLEYDIVPLEELGRPRLNVVVHMTGLFRDLFPNVLDDLNRLFRQVSRLEESDELNVFKAHTRQTETELLEAGYAPERAADLACARLFGPPEGVYGTTVTRLIETKQWTEEAELGRAYADSQQHVYSMKERGREEPELFAMHLRAVDIVSQIRSSHEREVTDSDHYYEYFGGLAKSVELARGRAADIHITDTTGERVLTEPAEHAIARGVRTRLTNPKWIDALLRHPFHGAQQIARRFEYVLGLAATTGKVEPWVFESLHDVYVEDRERSRQMAENNRWAYHALIETLLESHQRGYWQPSAEELERLRHHYVELEGELEEAAAE
ncbi:cobaltochelatase subunit CobN [Paenibacillus hodogayensis]|uniref:Cobaltochelatase subunit CobN n=1 Tax=Paenibacillus hodogayensis TaxID=279208 RepID=A0ABV5VYX3_9BACL